MRYENRPLPSSMGLLGLEGLFHMVVGRASLTYCALVDWPHQSWQTGYLSSCPVRPSGIQVILAAQANVCGEHHYTVCPQRGGFQSGTPAPTPLTLCDISWLQLICQWWTCFSLTHSYTKAWTDSDACGKKIISDKARLGAKTCRSRLAVSQLIHQTNEYLTVGI